VLKTRLTELANIDHPIIQAGMGADAGPALAAAVSNAGALGSLGTIGAPASLVERHIAETRAATGRPFAVNVITFDWAPFASELVDVVIRERVPVVTLSFGSFEGALERCKAAGLLTIVQAQDIAGVRSALAGRADAVIVQGSEAGGHTGQRGTMSFAAQALDLAGDTPIIVAGGVGSGRGLAASVAMGAAGVVMGTRFKATEEFRATATQKAALVASDGENTRADPVFDGAYPIHWPEGIVGRAMLSRFTEEWSGRADEVRARAAEYSSPFGMVMELARDPATEINWAGESTGLVHEVLPAAEVVRRTVEGAEACLRALPTLVAR